jgi:5'-3' exonuclease
MTRKLLLIDGDQFVFTATVAIEKETKWDDHNHVLYSNPDLAWENFDAMIKRIFERFETDDHVLAFSSPNNFRYGVDPTYKSNRQGTRKPLCYSLVRDMCDEHYTTSVMDGLEADDVMGILATKPGTSTRIIVSQDKDMKTIPTTVWTGKDLLHLSEEEADYNFLYQTLIGDITDGYKGCPGVGPVKATKLLTVEVDGKPSFTGPPSLWWPRVTAAYEKAGLTADDALTQARLARILRWSDWDTNAKKPILWTP